MRFPPIIQDRQPQGAARIDWGNPLSRGLSFVWLPQAPFLSLANGLPVVASGQMASSAGPLGFARVGSASGYSRFDGQRIGSSTGYTVLAVVFDRTGRGANRNPIDADNPSGVRTFQFRVNASNLVELIAFRTGANGFATSATATSSTAPTVMAGRVRANGDLTAFLNGRPGTTVALGGTPLTLAQSGSRVAIGQRADAAGQQPFGGDIFGGLYWDRELSDAEIASISANPWQLFEPERRIWLPVSVSGSFSAAAGLAVEADTAIARGVAIGLGLATETDTAIARSFSLSAPVGLAVEADAALTLAATQARALGLAVETDTAFALSSSSGLAIPVGLAVETDTALARTATQAAPVGLATETDTALVPGQSEAAPVGGYYEDAPKPKRKKLTVLHKDDRAEKEAEFEALLARVSGQAKAKAVEAAAKPIEITKPPRMPEIRGVESFYLRQYLPDLIGAFDQAFQATYQAEKQAQIDAMAQAQAAIAKAKFEAEEEEIALLAMLL